MSPTPVHVVGGFLGAGKTTLLLDQLARRAERCAIVVNDFGEARIDATVLGGSATKVIEIPGGCVCCTAPEGIVPSLSALLEELAPDRIFIEPTGLARTADLIDTLARSELAPRLELAPVITLVDPSRLIKAPPPLLIEQLESADIIVGNHSDHASEAALTAFSELCEQRYPPLLATALCERGVVALELFDARRQASAAPDASEPPHDHAHDHAAAPSSLGYTALSKSWGAERVFSMRALRSLIADADLERVKGLFNTDIGWYLVERAGGRLEAAPTAYRGASRVDLIALDADTDGAEALLEALAAARHDPREDAAAETLRLISINGDEQTLDRAALSALPGQVDDVSALCPGREGRGVRLGSVLSLAPEEAGARFILCASDGMSSEPIASSEVGGAILVHSLEELAYPRSKGGPFRVFVPAAEAASRCANVKKLVRIQNLAP